MTPYVLKDADGNIFAEGVILSNERCFINFIKYDYTFVYDNINQLLDVHGAGGKNVLEYDTFIANNDDTIKIQQKQNEDCVPCDGSFKL